MSNRPAHSSVDESELEHVHGPNCRHDHVAMPATFRRETPKLGRNDPCHCGGGKKFKKCHGANIDD